MTKPSGAYRVVKPESEKEVMSRPDTHFTKVEKRVPSKDVIYKHMLKHKKEEFTARTIWLDLKLSSKRRALEALDRLENEGLISSTIEFVKTGGNTQEARVFKINGRKIKNRL